MGTNRDNHGQRNRRTNPREDRQIKADMNHEREIMFTIFSIFFG